MSWIPFVTVGEAGKGDRPRPVNKKQYDKNYERIFGKKEDMPLLRNGTMPGSKSIIKCPGCKKNRGIKTFIDAHGNKQELCRSCREDK
jgi:hypothetical protein